MYKRQILIVAVFGLLALLLITGLQSCTVMAGTAGTGVTASSYFSKDKDMLGAEKAYAKLEQKLQRYLDTYEAVSYTHLDVYKRQDLRFQNGTDILHVHRVGKVPDMLHIQQAAVG